MVSLKKIRSKTGPTWAPLLLWGPRRTHALRAEVPGDQPTGAGGPQVTGLRRRARSPMLFPPAPEATRIVACHGGDGSSSIG